MKTEWRILAGLKVKHCWRIREHNFFVRSSCGLTRREAELEVAPFKATPRCKNCERALAK